MKEKDFQIIDLKQEIDKLKKDNADMKIVVKSVGDLAFANNDAIQLISDKFNEFLDNISKNK